MRTLSQRVRNFARFAVATLLLCASGTAFSGSATLTWTAPTQNEDGSQLTDLAGYHIYSGCQQSGQYERPAIRDIPASITSLEVTALPEAVDCYFVATAYNDAGVESKYSNEATKFIESTVALSGPVENLSVTWQESDVQFIEVPWTTKPPPGTPIDWSHPLAQGLTAFVIPTGPQSVLDVVNQRSAGPAGGTFFEAQPKITNIGDYQVDLGVGIAMGGDGTEAVFEITGYNIAGGTKITMAAGSGWYGSAASSEDPIFEIRNSGNNRRIRLAQRGHTGANRRHLTFTVDLVGSGTTCDLDEVDTSSEFPITAVGSYGITVASEDSDNDVQQLLHPNGYVQNKTDAGTNNQDTLDRIRIESAATTSYTTYFVFGAWWNDRVLTLEEKREFQRNPWQIFEPQRIAVFVPDGAAPAANPVGRLTLLGVGR